MKEMIEYQYKYFNNGYTKSVKERIRLLKELLLVLNQNEELFAKALLSDLNKSDIESFYTEFSVVYKEIELYISKLKKWTKAKKVSTEIINYPSKSYILPCPQGVVLIIPSWSFPFKLALLPFIGAIAGGNSVILKLSEKTPQTSKLLHLTIKSIFNEGHANCILKAEIDELLEYEFSHIFFEGDKENGKKIAQKAVDKFTKVTLQLGGKNPCIIDETANLKLASRRILLGKTINAGQNSLAPDYILIKSGVKKKFLKHLSKEYAKLIGNEAKFSKNYTRIVDEENYKRLKNMLLSSDIYVGGKYCDETLQILPSITKENDISMEKEIFGPILPIIEFETFMEMNEILAKNPSPLALYLFTENKKVKKFIFSNYNFAGGCINDTLIHETNNRLPFGGVKNSGNGACHGKYTFDNFVHYKGVSEKYKREFKIKYTIFK